MIFARAILGQELILVGAIGLAMALIYLYLRQRSHLDLLRRVWLPMLLWAVFGTLDALVTIVGTWNAPWNEDNPTTRAFLLRWGWVGLVIATVLYVLFWALVVDGLESLRLRFGGAWATALGAVQLLILYALAMGHLGGFLSWTPYFPLWSLIDLLRERLRWLYALSPLGYGLYIGLVFGGLCAALHLTLAALLRRTGPRPFSVSPVRDFHGH